VFRTTIPLILGFIVGVFMFLEYFIPHWRYQAVKDDLLEYGAIIAAGAFVLGFVNVIQIHLPKVIERQKGWGNNAVLLISMFVMFGFGLVEGPARMDAGQSYMWLFDHVYTPLNQTMFSLLAFYIASAAFRAFRARNVDATILLVAACVVMLARVPIGETVPYLREFMSWIMDVPNVAARRAIFVGTALGAVATGIRVVLGIERSHLGGD